MEWQCHLYHFVMSLYMPGSACMLFLWCIHLLLHQYHTIFIIMALQSVFILVEQAFLSFHFNVDLAICTALFLQKNF